ncbi:MAG TPA: hypothetical protein VM287_10440, partial [Egibacteraceae bacterium]|nr:hypothetical protein [Egibacteraceae bacterium]
MSPGPAEIAAGAAAFLLIVALLWARRSRRSTVRRVVALTARMGDEGLELEGRGGLERTLSRLERAAGVAVA